MKLYKQIPKNLMIFLSMVAVFVIVFVPALTAFKARQYKCTEHHSGTIKRSHDHVAHFQPDHSWSLIRNKHLSAPPLPLKVKAAVLISLLYILGFVFIKLHSHRFSASFIQGNACLSVPKYLTYRVFLI